MDEEKNYIIYKHISPSNKIYIGVTSQNPKRRWRNGAGYNANIYFTRAIQKYGWDNFIHEILFTKLSKRQAEYYEIKLISEYDSTNPENGYNIQNGGSLSGKMTPESKEKISLANKGRKFSEETIKKFSQRTGDKNQFYGKQHSDETKKIIGDKIKTWKGKYGKEHNKSKMCICVETDEIYFSTREAERLTGIDHSSINRCCNNKQNKAGKYHWKYI